MSKLAFRAQTVDIAYLPLRQHFLAKNVLMTAQRDFRLGNSLLIPDTHILLREAQSRPVLGPIRLTPTLDRY
jgi:hypothetical protein